jgi:hypothetical protein
MESLLLYIMIAVIYTYIIKTIQDADTVISQVLKLLESVVTDKAGTLADDARAVAAVKRIKYEPLPKERYTSANTDEHSDWHTTDNNVNTMKQRKSVMTKLHYIVKHLQYHANSSSTNGCSSDISSVDDDVLHWLVQYIEYSQFRAATDINMFSDSDTLVTRWQWISQQFIAELQLAATVVGKRKYAKYSSSSSSSSKQKVDCTHGSDNSTRNNASNSINKKQKVSDTSAVTPSTVKHKPKRRKSNSSGGNSSNADVHCTTASQQQQQQQQQQQKIQRRSKAQLESIYKLKQQAVKKVMTAKIRQKTKRTLKALLRQSIYDTATSSVTAVYATTDDDNDDDNTSTVTDAILDREASLIDTLKQLIEKSNIPSDVKDTLLSRLSLQVSDFTLHKFAKAIAL